MKFLIELPETQKTWATILICAIILLYQSKRNEQKEIEIRKEYIFIINELKKERALLIKEINKCKDQRFEDANYFRDKFLELKNEIK